MATTTELERLIVRLTGDATEYRKMLKEAETATKSTEQKFRDIGSALTKAITLPLSIIGGLAVRSFANFEDAMVKATAILNVTEDQMRSMEQTAIDLSKTVTHSATELANGFLFLGQAGKSAEQSIALLPVVSRFAAAGNFDLAKATDLVTDAQSALGLASQNAAEDMETMTRVTDVLTKAGTISTASTQQFSEALTNKAGPALRSYNKSIEEGTAVLATYAQQGIKGRQSGEMLARVLRILPKAARDASDAHEMLGFKVFDASGKMRNIADIIQNLEGILGDMSDEMKSATLEALGFEVRIQQAILPLIGMSDQIREFEKTLDEAGGTTDEIAKKQLKSFSAQMKVLKNNVSAVFIEIGKNLVPVIKALAKIVEEALKIWNSFGDTTKSIIVSIGVLVATIGPLLFLLGKLGLLAASAGTAMSLLTGGLVSANLTVMLLARAFQLLIGIAVINWISSVTGRLFGLNKELERSKELAEKLAEIQAARGEKVVAQGTNIESPIERRRFFADALKEANASMRAFTDSAAEARKEIDRLNAGPLLADQRTELIGRMIQLGGINARIKQQAEYIKTVEEAYAKAKIEADNFMKVNRIDIQALNNLKAFESKLKDILGKLKEESLADEMDRLIKEAFQGKVPAQEIEGFKVMFEFYNKMIHAEQVKGKWKEFDNELVETIELLKEEVKWFGKSTDEVRALRMEKELESLSRAGDKAGIENVVRARMDEIRALREKLRLAEQEASLMREAADLTDRLLDPLQRYNKEVEHLKKLQPFLDPVTFDKAMKEAKDKLDSLTQATKEARRELEMLDGVLFGSAEARSRIKDYADMLRNVPDGSNAPGVIPARGKGIMNIINPVPPPKINVPNIPNIGAAITPIQNLAKRVPDILMQGFAKILPQIAPTKPVAPKPALIVPIPKPLPIAPKPLPVVPKPIPQAQLKTPTPQDIMKHLTIPKDMIESLGPVRIGEILGDRLTKDYADAALDRSYAKSLRERAIKELQSIPDSKHLGDISHKRRFADNFFAIANLMDRLANAKEAAITEINTPQPTDRNTIPDKDQDKQQKEVTTRLDKAVKFLEMIAKKQGIEVQLTDFT